MSPPSEAPGWWDANSGATFNPLNQTTPAPSGGPPDDAKAARLALEAMAAQMAEALPPSERTKFQAGITDGGPQARQVYEVYDLMLLEDRVRLVNRLNSPDYQYMQSSMNWVTEPDGTTHLYYCYAAKVNPQVYNSWLREQKGEYIGPKDYHDVHTEVLVPKPPTWRQKARALLDRLLPA